jgi:nucleoside-diphosphate-sugar epimerase
MSRLFCFGLGFCAVYYLGWADVALAAGTVREKPQSRASQGIRVFVFDPSDTKLHAAIAKSDRVLVSVPPNAEGDPVLRHFRDALPRDASIVYLSSLGVYGDYAGAVVTEESECRPHSVRSRARLQAEHDWARFAEASGSTLTILRLAGIYGPQRNTLTHLKNGAARRIAKPGQVFNRIHVGDIAQAIGAAFESKQAGIFNVADDEPSPPGDPIVFAARLLGVATPPEIPFEQARLTMSPMALSFYEECRRADNTRMKSALGVGLLYPSYREGLQALFEAGDF